MVCSSVPLARLVPVSSLRSFHLGRGTAPAELGSTAKSDAMHGGRPLRWRCDEEEVTTLRCSADQRLTEL
jgi:hypothetical protein